MNVHKGFTLVEMLSTIAVATVLISIAAPSFVQLSRNNRLITYANDVIATVNLARSEAIRQGVPVTICRSRNGTSCSGTWSDGWIVFVDTNGDGVKAANPAEPILRTHEALATKYTLAGSAAFANRITYGADGAAHASGVFAVCHDGQIKGARAVVVTRLRPRTARDTDDPPDGIPNKDTGNIASCTAP